MKEYYSTLGVSEEATKDEIKNAYKTLARKYHPDLNPNNKEAETQFKKLSEAYQVLSDDKKRKEYDSEGFDFKNHDYSGKQGPFYYESQSTGRSRYQDIFNDLFGGGEAASNTKFKGEDFLFRMEIDFNDSILGAKRHITLPNNKNFEVKIPPGIKHGQKLRFKGEGGTGVSVREAGDMFIEIVVRPSGKYKRIGNDLEYDLKIPFSTAILGGKARVPCIDGYVELSIPEEISAETRLRIKGKGVRQKINPGDLFVKIKIEIPKNIPKEFKRELSKWKNRLENNL